MRVPRPNSTLKVDTDRPLGRRKGLSGGKPLERKPTAKAQRARLQSRLSVGHNPPGYDYEALLAAVADRDGADCWVRRHVELEDSLRACDGGLDAHHLLSKSWLKREFRDGRYKPNGYRARLASILNDPRNAILVCRRHHDLLENARIKLSLPSLPARVGLFARELGAVGVARLERLNGSGR